MVNLEDVLAFAEDRHRGQFRDSGEPYIVHPKRVGNILDEVLRKTEPDDEKKREDMVAAAYGHDLREDTKTKHKELQKRFGDRPADLVKEVTSCKLERKLFGKAKYLKHKMKGMTPDGLSLKLADRLDNVSDMGCYTEAKRQSKYAETREILDYLESNRDLTETHKQLIARIKAVINSDASEKESGDK